MDQENRRPLTKRTQLPPEAGHNVSAVLNGLGNGMMVGAMPFMAINYLKSNGKENFSPAKWASGAFWVASTAIGVWWGCKDAQRTNDYQRHVTDEINRLSDRLEQLERR